jgi:DNA-3-methyladenine glycosylase II
MHSPDHPVGISPKKLSEQDQANKSKSLTPGQTPKRGTENGSPTKEGTPDLSSVPPATVLEGNTEESEAPKLPPPFTPSIKQTLAKPAVDPEQEPDPLPEGLTVAVLKSRLDGKKKIKCVFEGPKWVIGHLLTHPLSFYRGALLTPKEMEDLTDAWKPYRSIGQRLIYFFN